MAKKWKKDAHWETVLHKDKMLLVNDWLNKKSIRCTWEIWCSITSIIIMSSSSQKWLAGDSDRRIKCLLQKTVTKALTCTHTHMHMYKPCWARLTRDNLIKLDMVRRVGQIMKGFFYTPDHSHRRLYCTKSGHDHGFGSDIHPTTSRKTVGTAT